MYLNIEAKYNVFFVKSIIFFFCYIFALTFYPLIVCESIAKYSCINFIIYAAALCITMFSFFSIKKNQVRTWNIFGLSYFFCLWLNSLQLSYLQVDKTFNDLYILIIGPLAFLLFLWLIDSVKVTPFKIKIKIFNLDYAYVLLTFLYVLLELYVSQMVGWRFDAIQAEHQIVSGEQFVVPLFSGLKSTIFWVLVILSPHVKKRYSIPTFFTLFIFGSILNVKRGNFIRISLFFCIYFFSSAKMSFSHLHKKFILMIVLILILSVFVMFGQWRLAQSGNHYNTIVEITGIRTQNTYVAWLFAYLVIQFDVFSLSYSALSMVPYEMKDFNTLLTSRMDTLNDTLIPIKGFNAGTAFWSFVRDYGNFFIIEMLFFLAIISCLVYFTKKNNCAGAYYFICFLCALMVFGNYFCSRNMVIGIIISNMIFLFSSNAKSVGAKRNG